MAYTNHLFKPLKEETFLDRATNSHFTLKGLVWDNPTKVGPPKTLQDKIARHVIYHGKMPDMSQFAQKKKEEKEDNEEVVKEDNFMSNNYLDHLYQPDGLQEGVIDTLKDKVSGLGKKKGFMDNLKDKVSNFGKKKSFMGNAVDTIKNNKGKLALGGAGLAAAGGAAALLKNRFGNNAQKSAAVGENALLSFSSLGESEGNSTGIAQQVGLGTPSSTANHLYQIPINQYQASDSNFITDGDSAETSKTNIPALLAAKNAGGKPHPFTVDNGINKRETTGGGFKLKPLRDDLGPNG